MHSNVGAGLARDEALNITAKPQPIKKAAIHTDRGLLHFSAVA
jgi:hypothetical protein